MKNESDLALRIYDIQERSNKYKATFLCHWDDEKIFYINSIPFSMMNVKQLHFIVYPKDTKKVLRDVVKDKYMCVFSDDCISVTECAKGLHPTFKIPSDTKALYVCTGNSEQECRERFTLFLIKSKTL